MSRTRKQSKELLCGLAFLAPNIVGFLAFMLLPLVFSFVMAFTNWDIRLHNMFKDETLKVVWFENFARLLTEPDFWKYLGNTAFLMLGIPFGIAGSLLVAIVLNQDLRGKRGRVRGQLIGGAMLIVGLGILVMAGVGATAMTILVGGVLGLILVGGVVGGQTVYRTLFYLPNFTAGVAIFLLWKKLYNAKTGPINNALRPVLNGVSSAVNSLPDEVMQGLAWLLSAVIVLMLVFGLRRLSSWWRDGELGAGAAAAGTLLLGLPIALCLRWHPDRLAAGVVVAASVLALIVILVRTLRRGCDFRCRAWGGTGNGVMLAVGLVIGQLILLGLVNVFYHLPAMALDGLAPPEWLSSYHWAKPSLIIMGLWIAVGSNNMLLYLAGLSSVPQALYEASDIDGASRWQQFWHVTWPQLAPMTFFIVIMSVIGGLQGGFEMARAMTQGGPAGSTTTLSYYIYTEGFETGRLGYAAAISWVLFLMVCVATLFNWKVGNKYVNE